MSADVIGAIERPVGRTDPAKKQAGHQEKTPQRQELAIPSYSWTGLQVRPGPRQITVFSGVPCFTPTPASASGHVRAAFHDHWMQPRAPASRTGEDGTLDSWPSPILVPRRRCSSAPHGLRGSESRSSRSRAIAPSHLGFLAGTDEILRRA